MGVSISGSGQILSRTTNLPPTSAYTMAGWVKVNQVRSGQYQYFFCLENATTNSTAWHIIGYQNAGPFELSTAVAHPFFSPQPPTGQWLYMFMQCNVATVTAGWMAEGDTNFNTTSSAGGGFPSAVMMAFGNDSWNEWCVVDLRGIKVWDAVLSDAELKAEKASTVLIKSGSINGFWDLPRSGSWDDSSGNGRTLAASGSGIKTSIDDPIIYSSAQISNYSLIGFESLIGVQQIVFS